MPSDAKIAVFSVAGDPSRGGIFSEPGIAQLGPTAVWANIAATAAPEAASRSSRIGAGRVSAARARAGAADTWVPSKPHASAVEAPVGQAACETPVQPARGVAVVELVGEPGAAGEQRHRGARLHGRGGGLNDLGGRNPRIGTGRP